MSRIVCDTNTIVSGFLWNSPPSRIIWRVLEGEDILYTSKDLLAELHRVLGYDKFKSICEKRGLGRDEIFKRVVEVAVLVMPKPLGETVIPNDRSDEAVLACAVSADAQVIVSGDKRHLLPLGTYRGIRILSAAEYLSEAERG